MILTIDLGTSGPKVALFSDNAEYIDSVFEVTETLILSSQAVEQSPQDWWRAISLASKKLLAKTKVDPAQIKIISTTAQWSGTVAIDKNGEPIRNAMIWMDTRGAEPLKKLMSGLIQLDGYELRKILTWLYKTNGAPGLAGKDPLAHILYLKEHEPDVFAKAMKFLEPVDYLTNRLTGKLTIADDIVASFHTITVHWLTNNRNLSKIGYDKTLLKWSGIPREKLPNLVPQNSKIGTLDAKSASELGLCEGTEVLIGSSDIMSAAIGSGAVTPKLPHVYIGTSSWLVCHLEHRVTDLSHAMVTLPSALPGLSLLTNEQECSGNSLKFLREKIFQIDDQDQFYDWISKEVSKIPPGSEGLVFLPWLIGERSPIEDSHVRGGFYNLSLSHSREHMARAVLEGVCLNLKWLFHYTEKNSKTVFDRIHFIGGGAQSELWSQIMADVLGVDVLQVEHPIMANSQGAAFLAAIATGKLTIDQIPSIVKIKRTFKPAIENRKLYEDRFKIFVKIYKQNKKIFKELNS